LDYLSQNDRVFDAGTYAPTDPPTFNRHKSKFGAKKACIFQKQLTGLDEKKNLLNTGLCENPISFQT
jgi:hypothetical protein